jgi:ribonucleoside-diphosphate reductase beta chain
MTRTTLKTTREGLDHRTMPMRLWRKAKKLGTWDPAAIDFTQDAKDWLTLSDDEQDLLLRLSAQFQGGEESVTYDLLPFLQWMAEQERIEDELFLTAYLWEEAKHVEGFDRFLREVTKSVGSLEHYYTEAYRTLFLEALPTSLQRLRTDPSPAAVAEAGVTYQMIVEGVLAETGYEAYASTLEANTLLPGMQTFVRKVQQDEARHIAYGVYLLSRLVAEHGDAVWDRIEDRMNELLPLIVDHIQATLAPYGDAIPFGVQAEDFVDFGMRQFQKRLQRIERAREQTVEDVLYG